MAGEGALVAVTPRGLIGWAWDPARPAETLRVRIAAGETILGEAMAERFDDWVAAAHGRPGVPGFVLTLPRLPDGPWPLELHLLDERGVTLGPPFTVAAEDALAPALDPDLAASVEGSVDALQDGQVVGWARDAQAPGLRLRVELVDGATVLGSAEADRFRQDLLDAGKGDGACGFELKLPAALLDGRPHALRVRIAGTRRHLGGREIGFGPQTAGALFEEVARLGREVERLGRLVDALANPTGPFQTEIVRTIADRVAAHSEIQRELVERELDALRRIAFADGPDLHIVPETPSPARPATPEEAAPRRPLRRARAG